MTRFKPSRAGLINIWDYTDEEFVFADGRLVLRGHNGSGKTKALEVLFPFILDGVVDARRLDPFSGENRTMKANLLYRGQESEYGFVWMEFAAGERTVTLVIALHAHKDRPSVKTAFFVTARRVGADFGLLTEESRPLTEQQLRKVLEPEAWHDSATAYRHAVDTTLFGLGRERYTQLLDLLLALRRPLLAKDLDPGKVSDTLTAGLSPVSEDLVEQAARDFENLAAVQRLADDLVRADDASRAFLDHYAAYLRVGVRSHLDRVAARTAQVVEQAAAIGEARAEMQRAAGAQEEAKEACEAAEAERSRLDGRLDGLKKHEAYTAQADLDGLRAQAGRAAQEIAQAREADGRAARHISDLQDEAGQVERRLGEAREAAGRQASARAEAAALAGIPDTGDDPEAARAQVTARLQDVEDVRSHLGRVNEAERERARAELAARASEEKAESGEASCATAERHLTDTRAQAATALTTWSAQWSPPHPHPLATTLTLKPDPVMTGDVRANPVLGGGVPADPIVGGDVQAEPVANGDVGPGAVAGGVQAGVVAGNVQAGVAAGGVLGAGEVAALAEGLGRVGEGGAPGLVEIFGELTEASRTALVTELAGRENELARLAEEAGRLAALRDEVAAERDDAPPLAATRPAGRATRPGAPLWRLVRFADGVADAEAAAVEGALDAAGLLTAWIHPDPVLTAAAVREAEADAFLLPAPAGARPAGRTLSSVLVPEEQDLVPARAIADVLDSIALTTELTVPAAAPAIGGRGAFSLGVHVGALPKDAPEYIGATHRAARRRARIAAHERDLEDLARRRSLAARERDALQRRLDDIGRAREGLRSIGRDIPKAVAALAEKSTLLAAARAARAEAVAVLDAATAEVDARRRRLRQAAADRAMPADEAGAEAVARAAGDFTATGERLFQRLADIGALETDLAGRRRTIARLDDEHRTAREALVSKEAAHLDLAERLAALEETLSAPLKEILGQIDEAEKELGAAKATWRAEDARAREEHDALVRATYADEHGRAALLVAVGELLDRLASFAPFAHTDLRPVLGVAAGPSWPDSTRWPEPGRVAAEVIDRLSTREPALAVRSVLPDGVAELLELYDAAAPGRSPGESARKGARDRMSEALKRFDDALNACEEDYRLDWEPGESVVVVRVRDADGRHPVAEFARRVAGRAREQGVLLEERERTVLEDELLAGLAQQIFDRVRVARDLVRGMDADTRSRPMSTGTTVGIRWVVSDKITDVQREVSELLGQDGLGAGHLAGLRRLLRQMIRDHRAAHPRATYKEVLSAVLDYRTWRTFELRLKVPGEEDVKLSKRRHSQMSGGEKSAAIHLPLFAAANSLYSSASPGCPRMIALDEAFAGIDDVYKPDLLGLTVRYDLDVFMTGHDLWARYDTVPAAAHYDMHSDKASHTVSAMLVLWDGRELVDSAAGFAGNEELAGELLGFTPTRRTPLPPTLLTLPEAP
ncbi:SbcC/MukB-like Walker B domain-containing protein [Sphaerisporangium corydalis]|uniref:SbcC/MukB-like Walker B domain-containing protein n=1 Tax=Sphaerisporangium corydalis TaxID=1441875 RepID=A0ABV9EFF0_9ACTN|nr:SbcC/MukB-like Walker B domain-containing protein [Sphaerisporangium corydalis]